MISPCRMASMASVRVCSCDMFAKGSKEKGCGLHDNYL
jgi:hypothetical protein